MHAACVKACKGRLLQRVRGNWVRGSKTGHSCSHRPVPWPSPLPVKAQSHAPLETPGYCSGHTSSTLTAFQTKWASDSYYTRQKDRLYKWCIWCKTNLSTEACSQWLHMSLIIQVMLKKLYNNHTEYLLDVVGELFQIWAWFICSFTWRWAQLSGFLIDQRC